MLSGCEEKIMEEIMDWTRKLTLEESAQIFAEDEEKRRRDRFAQDEFVFEKGRLKERQEVALNMLKRQVELSLVSEVTGLSIEELKKLKK